MSSEIIDKLAAQQSRLVHAMDILRVRTSVLLWTRGLLELAVIALLVLAVGR